MTVMYLDVEFGGSLKAQQSLMLAVKKQKDAYAAGVYLAFGNVMSTSVRLTPVDSGFLRKTRYVEKPIIIGDTFIGTMGYSASYALAVHEVWAQHPTGEWKFLLTAIQFHAPRMLDDIARLTKKFAESGIGLDQVTTDHPTGPLIGPVPPRPRRTGRARRRWEQKRSSAFEANRSRVGAESRQSLAAQRSGARGPKPGSSRPKRKRR